LVKVDLSELATVENVMQFSTVIGQFTYCLTFVCAMGLSLEPLASTGTVADGRTVVSRVALTLISRDDATIAFDVIT